MTLSKTFEETFGEKGYSAYQLASIFLNLDFGRNINSPTIQKYAEQEGMLVDVRELNLDLNGKNTRYLIAESNLEELMEVCGVEATLEEFNEQVEFKRRNKKAITNVSRREAMKLMKRGYDL